MRQFGVKDLESDDEAEVPVDALKAKEIEFERSKKGHFVLPPMSNFKTIKQRQRLVRGYIGAVYRKYQKMIQSPFFSNSNFR